MMASIIATASRGYDPAADSAAGQAADLVSQITADPGLRRVAQLAKLSGLSERKLQRLFSDYVGVSPKWVMRRARLHEAALRVELREPRRGRGGRRRKVCVNAVGVQEVEQAVKPVEHVLAGSRLEQRPGEDADRDDVDTGLVHEPHVFLPHVLRPLLGVVVPAVENVGNLR